MKFMYSLIYSTNKRIPLYEYGCWTCKLQASLYWSYSYDMAATDIAVNGNEMRSRVQPVCGHSMLV